MIVKAKVNIKHNGEKYSPGHEFEIEEKHFESIKDIVEIIDNSTEDIKEDIKEDIDTEESDLTTDDLSEENTLTNVIDYDALTKPEIVEILEERGIEHNSRDKKENLVELLVGSEQNDQ